MTSIRIIIVAALVSVMNVAPAAAYLFPYDDQEYALCGWGGSCASWFTPRQTYFAFEPDPRQYEFVETYPMGYSDVATEWRDQAMNWVQYARVNPAFTWGDDGSGYSDPMMTYTHPYDGYYAESQLPEGQVYGIAPSYYSLQQQYYNISI